MRSCCCKCEGQDNEQRYRLTQGVRKEVGYVNDLRLKIIPSRLTDLEDHAREACLGQAVQLARVVVDGRVPSQMDKIQVGNFLVEDLIGPLA